MFVEGRVLPGACKGRTKGSESLGHKQLVFEAGEQNLELGREAHEGRGDCRIETCGICGLRGGLFGVTELVSCKGGGCSQGAQ